MNLESAGRRSAVFARATLAAVLLFSICFRATYINRPFERDPEGCGSFYGLLARNYLRYPITLTKGVPVQSLWAADVDVVFYANHPPLLPLLIAGTYRICGFDADGQTVPPDWETRLSTVLFTLGCIGLVYVLVARRVSKRAGALAAFFFATAPLVLLYGGQPDVINSQLVFFALLSAAAYERFCDRPDWGHLALLAALLLPACLSDWVAFYLPVVFAGHFVLTHRPRSWGWAAAIGLVACVFFGAEYLQDVAVTHHWNWMGQLVARRTLSNVADSNTRITVGSWLRDALLEHGVLRHGWAMCFFALGWVVMALRRRIKNTASAEEGEPSAHPDRLIALLLAWAALHVLVGRQGVLVHEWWWWPVTPALAMAGGVFLDRAISDLERHGRSWGYALSVYLLLAATAVLNVFNVTDELAHPKRIVFSNLDYGITEIGQAIRDAVPPGSAVMLAESDDSLSLWFYADRPLKRNVWSAWDVEECLRNGTFDIPFGRTQQFDGPVAAVIVPKAYLSSKLDPLLSYLRAHAKQSETQKFLVFEFPPAPLVGRG